MKVWALLDDRAGNVGQVIGLAEALGYGYDRKELKYNSLATLPNIIRGASLIGLENKEIVNGSFPELVIAAGRRSAPIARYIKKYHPTTKLVQIMWPDVGMSEFDWLIVPEHDNKKPASNIITTIGALHKLNDQLLQQEKNKWIEKFAYLPRPYIVTLVGGNSKNGNFTEAYAKELGMFTNTIAKNLQGSLLITSSRRTDEKARLALEQTITMPNYFYYYGVEEENPYLGYLALADYIIVTGDSVAMASEACFTGKPVYIYSPSDITGDKHRKFQQQLFTGGYAKLIGKENFTIDFKPTSSINETMRVATIIKQQISLRFF
jgi:mitochondrial fission protein ELM1